MQIGVVDCFHATYPKYTWVADAAERLGWDVIRMGTPDELWRRQSECDWVLFSQRPPIAKSSLERGEKLCPWFCWVFDLLGHGIESLGGNMINEMPFNLFDCVFCKNPDALIGVAQRTRWLDQGCPRWQVPDGERTWDVLIAGRHSKRREAWAQACQEHGLSVCVAGTRGWAETKHKYLGLNLADEDLRRQFGQARFTICDNLQNDISGYWSDRAWLAIAAGCVPVGPWIAGMERMPRLDDCWIAMDTADEAWRLLPIMKYCMRRLARDMQGCAAQNRYEDRLIEMKGHIDGINQPSKCKNIHDNCNVDNRLGRCY